MNISNIFKVKLIRELFITLFFHIATLNINVVLYVQYFIQIVGDFSESTRYNSSFEIVQKIETSKNTADISSKRSNAP